MKAMCRLLGALFIVLTILVSYASLAGASPAEDAFGQKINQERSARGIHTLSLDTDLLDIARAHSKRMATENRLYHNPTLTTQVRQWDILGENVGRGPDVDAIHEAFMVSPNHQAQIVATDYRGYAVGVYEADGEVWVTEIFVLRPPGYSPPAVVKASAARKPKPPAQTPAPAAAPEPVIEVTPNRSLIQANRETPALLHYLIDIPQSLGLSLFPFDEIPIVPLRVATGLLFGGIAFAQGLWLSGRRRQEMTAITSPS